MSFGTDALVWVHFNRTTFDSKESVREYIEEKKREQELCRKELQSLVYMTEPKKFCPEDCDPASWISETYEELMEGLETATVLRDRAEYVLEAWDYMHHENGCALVDPGKPDMEALQRINGDFIPCCFPDGSNAYPDCETATSLYNRQLGIKEEGE